MMSDLLHQPEWQIKEPVGAVGVVATVRLGNSLTFLQPISSGSPLLPARFYKAVLMQDGEQVGVSMRGVGLPPMGHYPDTIMTIRFEFRFNRVLSAGQYGVRYIGELNGQWVECKFTKARTH